LAKADLVPPEQAASAAAAWRERVAFPVLVTSSATGAGLPELRGALLERVPVAEPVVEGAGEDEVADYAVFRPAAGREFAISRGDAGEWVVSGEAVERLIARFDMDNEEAQAHVERRLARMGVLDALAREGFEPGDDVEIGGIVFELDPGAPF
jgi:GTP-binding protein